MRRFWTILLILCVTVHTRAATIDGAGLPDNYPVGSHNLVLNGLGIRRVTIFNVRAYVAGLYLPKRSSDASAILASPAPKVILIQFLHSATKSQVEDHYREGEQHNCGHGECSRADQADFERLIAATPPMAVGDTLAYIFDGAHLRVLANNREIGDFSNPDLAEHLLAGFIGATPPSPDLRSHLLGQAG